MSLSKFIKRQFTRRGLWVARKTSVLHDRWAEELYFDPSFVIAHLLVQKSPLQFVQIGAFDGVSNDFLAPFVRRGLLQGLMVEPEPFAFAQLEANCGDRTGVQLSQLAVARESGAVRMHRVKPEFHHLHEAAAQLTSLDPQNIRKWLADRTPSPDDVIESFEVRAVTFEQLLAEHKMSGLDVLQIDTEGYDAEIIRMIPFARLRPTIINFEILNLSKADTESTYTLLMNEGYRLHESQMDCTAYLASACVLQ